MLLASQDLARRRKFRMKTSKRQQFQKIGILDVPKYNGACLRILPFRQPYVHWQVIHNISIN
jgi:hypothetical protein